MAEEPPIKTFLTPKEMASVLRDRPPGDLYSVDLRDGTTGCRAIMGGSLHVATQLEKLDDDLTISRVMVLEYADAGR
jgi:hypothetical protein